MTALVLILAAVCIGMGVGYVAVLVLDDLAATREAATDPEHEDRWEAIVGSQTPIRDRLAMERFRADLARDDAAARRLLGGGA